MLYSNCENALDRNFHTGTEVTYQGPPTIPSQSTLSFEEASAVLAREVGTVLATPPLPEPETCPLEHALGRVLASAVRADRDQPPFDRATRDGYAVRAQDLLTGSSLRVIGQLRAGEPWGRGELGNGEAIEIMTGAPLPPGANAVLMVEHVEESTASGSQFIRMTAGRTLLAGENVVSKGSEARQDSLLLEAGTRIGPAEIAVAASCGLQSVAVHAIPTAAAIATGDELAEPGTAILAHQIFDSNSRSLAALVAASHALPIRLPLARDQRVELRSRIQAAAAEADLLLLTGGVSMGKYDLVEEALTDLGAEFFFTGVRMQPGKPVVFGRLPATDARPLRYFFALPGNPVSVMVTFNVFVRPLLAAMAGERNWQPAITLAKLATELRQKPGLTRFLPAVLDTRPPLPTVTLVKTQGSGDLAANARANCYLMVPDDCEALAAGQTVRVLLR